MPRRYLWCLVLLSSACGLLSCSIQPPLPQPNAAQSYALIVLPSAIHLLRIDTQILPWQTRVQEMRVTPGPHSLRMTYEGSSLPHRNQQDMIFRLEAQAGHQYSFEAKTCGIFWRPAVAEHTLIAGYCTTHPCTEEESVAPPRTPRTPKCNTD